MNSVDPSASRQASPSPTQSQIAVSVQGATVKYHDQTVLHDLSLQIQQGELLTLLGPSGCGKTTLLNLIAGFVQANSGEIFVDQQRVTDLLPHKRQIGIVFQNYALFPHMDVERNIGYGLRMRGVPAPEITERVKAVMALVKLDGLEHRRSRELSGGQQQRVALARALVIKPKVLLLDEPFSALDKNLRGSMQFEVREIQRKLGVTTIFVTHDQGEALSMSDRIAVISQGRICQISTPDQIYRYPADRFVASFLGDVNVLPAHFDGEDGANLRLRLGLHQIAIDREQLVGDRRGDGRVDIYVRPEHVHLESVNADSILTGTVVHHVFQGDHCDTYVNVDLPASGSQRVMVRSPGLEVMARWPVGTVTGLALAPRDMSVFPAVAA